MMGLQQKLTLRSWILVTLLPTIGALAMIYSIATYRGLHGIVLDGFDQKLKAVGTVTAALIESEDHEALMEAPDVIGLSTRPDQAGLWTLRRNGDIFVVNPATGYASPSVGQTPPPFSLVAADSLPGAKPLSILLIDGGTGQVSRYHPESTEVEPLHRIPSPIRLLTTDPESSEWWTLGDQLRRVDLATGDSVVIGAAPTGVISLAYDSDRGVLWALAEPGDVLYSIDPATGESTSRIALQFDPTDESGFVASDRRVALRAIGYDTKSQTLFATADSLLRIEPTTGLVSIGDLISAFGREQSETYLRYVAPMRELQNLAATKYLYTQRVDEASHITYGLDASIGEEHAPLLSLDTIPTSAIDGIADLQEDGSLYISEIQEWDQWGLIKSAFVPIFDPVSGHVVAMAGADIDITTIRFETHRALVVTVGAGVALLIAAGAYSLMISRQLTDPLSAIREGALRAAAGHYQQKLVIERPRELRNLAVGFSAAIESLDELIQSSAQQAERRRQRHTQAALNTRLTQLIVPASSSANQAWGRSSPTDDPNAPLPASGLVSIAGGSLLWLDATQTKSRQAHAINTTTARRLAEGYGDDLEGLTRTLRAIAEPTIAWYFLPPKGAAIPLHGTSDATSPWAQISWEDDGGMVFICPRPEHPIPPHCLAGADAGHVCDAVLAHLPAGHFVLVNRS